MNCMKCGREVEDGQVFCPACQEDMEKYPVRPGTVVLLPKREETHYVKKSTSRRRAAPTPEEQIRSLKARLRLVTLMLLVSLTLMAVLIYPMAKEYLEDQQQRPGQNYTSITEATKIP